MTPPRHEFRVLLAVAGLGTLLVTICSPQWPRQFEYIAIGLLFGTLFSHATLTAAWTVLGPWPLVLRLPFSLAWLAAIMVGLSINLGLSGGPADILVVLAACLIGQWMLTQVPLWALAIGYGIRIRQAGAAGESRSERQFGIRQLIFITAIVGVVLGIGRAVVLALAPRFRGGFGEEGVIFVFLAVAGILLTLPLILAAMLPRRAKTAVCMVLSMIGLFTAYELPLLQTISSTRGPDLWHFILINGFQGAWILTIAALLHAGGYALTPRSA